MTPFGRFATPGDVGLQLEAVPISPWRGSDPCCSRSHALHVAHQIWIAEEKDLPPETKHRLFGTTTPWFDEHPSSNLKHEMGIRSPQQSGGPVTHRDSAWPIRYTRRRWLATQGGARHPLARRRSMLQPVPCASWGAPDLACRRKGPPWRPSIAS